MKQSNVPSGCSQKSGVSGSPLGAVFLAIALFFLIAFASNAILSQVTLATLGITITISTLILMAIVILILFVL